MSLKLFTSVESELTVVEVTFKLFLTHEMSSFDMMLKSALAFVLFSASCIWAGVVV